MTPMPLWLMLVIFTTNFMSMQVNAIVGNWPTVAFNLFVAVFIVKVYEVTH